MLDIESGGAAETSALDLLATLVAEPTLASATWTLLIAHGQQLAVDRSGTERAALQRHLVANRLGLLAIVDYRAEIARLEVTTNRALSSLDAGLVTIPGPAGAITIDRAAITDLYIAAAAGPLLVVGDPGCGKTVALHGLARHLLEHRTVLFLPVGSLPPEA